MGKREDDENKAEPKGLDDEIKEKLNRRVWGEGKENIYIRPFKKTLI